MAVGAVCAVVALVLLAPRTGPEPTVAALAADVVDDVAGPGSPRPVGPALALAAGEVTGAPAAAAIVSAAGPAPTAAGSPDRDPEQPPAAGVAPGSTEAPAPAPAAAAQAGSTTTATTTADPGSSTPPGPSASTAATRPGATPTPVAPAPTSTAGPRPSSSPQAPATTAPSTAPSTTPAPTPTPTPTVAAGGGGLVWAEEFDRLDTSRWALEHSTYGDGNNELQCYRPDNVSVVGGALRLRAVTETYTCPNGSTRSVTSGMVRSRGVTFRPGQALEFRVRLTPADPTDQGGLWPAVWSSGWAGGGWPRGGELDFLEVMTAKNPNRSVFSIHYARPDGRHAVDNREHIGGQPFSGRWHVVRFEYGLGGRLVWYLDGVQVHRVDAANTVQGYPAPFDEPINEIKLNLALGGRPGPLAPGAVRSRGALFEVDYLRIHRL